MEKTLVVLAAGMGSRFGGLKQIEPVGPNGEFLIDYSIHDALKAGFTKCVFVIRKDNLEIFKSTIGERVASKIQVIYAFQELDILPRNINVERTKPLGTAHALYCAKDYIKGPFAIISSDDFYGYEAFKTVGRFLDEEEGIACIGYKIGETILSDEEVKRGVIIDNNGTIERIVECRVSRNGELVKCVPINGDKEFNVPSNNSVNMLMYGFNMPSFFDVLEEKLNIFLDTADLSKDEFFLPNVVDSLISQGVVKHVKTDATWMGMTYKEDLKKVQDTISDYINKGIYKNNLWED